MEDPNMNPIGTFDGVEAKADRSVGEEEARAYVAWARDRFGDDIEQVSLGFEEGTDFVDVEVKHAKHVPFERIRRITGYLVGSMERFNDAKKAEVADRVKHTVMAKGQAWLDSVEGRRGLPKGDGQGQRVHGSSDEDEMRARMRDAGWTDYEIEEEIAERHAAFELAEGHPTYDPARIVAERMTTGAEDASSRGAGALVGSPVSGMVPMRGNEGRRNPTDAEEASRRVARQACGREAADGLSQRKHS